MKKAHNKKRRIYLSFKQSSLNTKDEEDAVQLKNAITRRETELKEKEQKFNEAGNSDYDNIVQLEIYTKKDLDLIGKNIKELLVREVQKNKKQIKEKLSRVIREFTQRQEYDYVNGCLKGLGLIVIVIVIVSLNVGLR